MELRKFEFNLFGENTYVIWNEVTSEAAVVDPGMSDAAETEIIEDFISENHLHIKYILLTHAHIDHTFGIDHLRERFGAPVLAHKADVPIGRIRDRQAQMFHLPVMPGPVEFDGFVDRNSSLSLGHERIEVLETPGHSPGGVCYYVPGNHFVLTGDSLFRGSIGRTDLPGGSLHQLVNSIRSRLMLLPPETLVYPGHGPATSIGSEAVGNPYL